MIARLPYRDDVPFPQCSRAQARPACPAIVLVENPEGGGGGRGHQELLRTIEAKGMRVRERIPLGELARIRRWLAESPETRPLIVAAGGDGAVGAVANAVAGTAPGLVSSD